MNQHEKQQHLLEHLQNRFGEHLDAITMGDMVTVELSAKYLLGVCQILSRESPFNFEQLIDLCGVDFLDYGVSEWRTDEATHSGFSRGVEPNSEWHADEAAYDGFNQEVEPAKKVLKWEKPRYAVVYHLLSVSKNQRLRICVYLDPEPLIPSVIDVWSAANWYEREAFDLFGIIFDGHPDLRRLLTDYGFIGHPFRKDFPLIGQVELRYDAAQQRCVYEPVSIQPRVLVPKVIRQDNRYLAEDEKGEIYG